MQYDAASPIHYRFLEPLSSLRFVVATRILHSKQALGTDGDDLSKLGTATLVSWQQKILDPVEAWSLAKQSIVARSEDSMHSASGGASTSVAHSKYLDAMPSSTYHVYLERYYKYYESLSADDTVEVPLPVDLGVVPPELPHRLPAVSLEDEHSLDSRAPESGDALGHDDTEHGSAAGASMTGRAGRLFAALAERSLHVSTSTAADSATHPRAHAIIAGTEPFADDPAIGRAARPAAATGAAQGGAPAGDALVRSAAPRIARMDAARPRNTTGPQDMSRPGMVISVSIIDDAEVVRGGGDDFASAVMRIPVLALHATAGDSHLEVLPPFSARSVDTDAEEDARIAAARRKRAKQRALQPDADEDVHAEGAAAVSDMMLHWTDIFRRFSSRKISLPAPRGSERDDSGSTPLPDVLSGSDDSPVLEVVVMVASELTQAEAVALAPIMSRYHLVQLLDLVAGSNGPRIALKALGIGSDAIDKAHATIHDEMQNRAASAGFRGVPAGLSRVLVCAEITDLSGVDSSSEYAVQFCLALRRIPAPPAPQHALYRIVTRGVTQTQTSNPAMGKSYPRSDVCCVDALITSASTYGAAGFSYPVDILIDTNPSDLSQSIVAAVVVLQRSATTGFMEPYAYGRAQSDISAGYSTLRVDLWSLVPKAVEREHAFFLYESVSVRDAPESLLPAVGNIFGLHTCGAGCLAINLDVATVFTPEQEYRKYSSRPTTKSKKGGISELLREADELSMKATQLGIHI